MRTTSDMTNMQTPCMEGWGWKDHRAAIETVRQDTAITTRQRFLAADNLAPGVLNACKAS
jgi:hypothetical protein